jgi:hypothetical protein
MSDSLRVQLHKRLDAWFEREARRLRDEHFANCAELKIVLRHPGGDDDGTLCLEAEVIEEMVVSLEGRVEGLKFEADAVEDGETQG